MIEIISSEDLKRLKKLSDLREMLSDDYLTNLQIYQTKFIYETFISKTVKSRRHIDGNYENKISEALKRLELLNISYGIPSLVCEIISDYINEPAIDLDIMHEGLKEDFCWAGYAVLVSRENEDGEFFVDLIEPERFIDQGDYKKQILTYYEQDSGRNKKQKYIFVQTYQKENGQWLLNNDLYLRDVQSPIFSQNNMGSGIVGKKVPLTSIPQTQTFAEQVTFDKNPIYIVHNRKRGQRYGSSEIAKVRSLISTIELQAVNIQDQLLKHLKAKIVLPTTMYLSNKVEKNGGKLDVSQLEAILTEAGMPDPKWLIQENPMIDKAFVYIDNCLKQIATELRIPGEFFQLKVQTGTESTDSKKLRMSNFFAKIDNARKKITKAYVYFMDLKSGLDSDYEIEDVVYPPIIPESKSELSKELAIAKDSGLISQVRAIMKYNNFSREEAEAELAAIRDENKDFDLSELGS